MRFRLRPQSLAYIEAALVGLFFLQALRYIIGMAYSRVAGTASPAGLTDAATVSSELTLLGALLLLPLLALVFGRVHILLTAAAVGVALGRLWMALEPAMTTTLAASVTVGIGLLYVALIIRRRARLLPYVFALGLALDQVWRALGDTLDPSWFPDSPVFSVGGLVIRYREIQIALTVLASVVSLLLLLADRREAAKVPRTEERGVSPDAGLLPFWGGLGLGALLFLELSLLSLPNAIAGRASTDYTTFVPLTMAATLLPMVPAVRSRARGFIALFDGGVRGWIWMLLLALLIVLGTRLSGIVGGVALVIAQFGVSMLWWWLARPQAEKERNFTGLWLVVALLIFLLLAAGDFFTYEYAYVSDLTGDAAFLNNAIPPLLRGFRGMGLGVLLLGVFLACIPMTQTRRRIPWAEQRALPSQSLASLAIVIALAVGSALAARPPLVEALSGADSIRVGTYNIHGGYDEAFRWRLEPMAETIQQSGANVVLLQEVETGRMTSFGVDESLWLARRLGMDRRFFGTNEGLQGLATLSNAPIVFSQGTFLSSMGQQTGAQHVQITMDGGASAVAFYNTWLGPLLDLSGARTTEAQEQDQQRQLSELFTLIARDYPELSNVRLVVGGTFNNVPGSPLIEQMRVSGFNDPFAGMPPELAATITVGGTRARFDYIFTRNVLPLGALPMESDASPHRMAVVEIQVNRRPG